MRSKYAPQGARPPGRSARRRVAAVIVGLAGFLCAGAASASAAPSLASWPSASQSILGERTQLLEFTINPQNVSDLKPKWVFTMNGAQGESATPTVANGVVYFPDWNGYLYAVDAQTGGLIWQQKISSYDGQPGQVSRNSPLIAGNELILGDNASSAQPGGAHVFAVSRADGHLLWSTQVDSNPAAIVTSNAIAWGNEVVVGVASNEEADAESPTYNCCGFRGAVVALNGDTGKLLWKTYTVPSNNGGGDSNKPCASSGPPKGCGYTGGAVWATPTIDPLTNQIFVGTGNNYTTPDAATACATKDQNAKPPIDDSNCTVPNDYFDSVIALNLQSGALEWGHKVQGYDAWNVACLIGYQPGATWCPAPGSPDFDFGGSSPNLFVVKGSDGLPQTLVGDGQKSGIYWAFDPATGKIVWNRLIGPGSSLGGIEWGSAYDGQRIYTTEANPALGGPLNTYTLCCGGGTASGGSWAALDPQSGAFDWQTPVPGGYAALGPVSVAGGVMFGESMDGSTTDPDMFALDASSGKILWSYPAGSSVIAGPSIVNGTVYWGAGYTHLGLPMFTGNDKLYAFTPNGK